MAKGPLDYCVYAFEADGHAVVGYGRGDAPWERIWSRRFHRDSRGPENAWLKRQNDMPPVWVVTRGTFKTDAVQMAAATRKTLRAKGLTIVGVPARKPDRRPVIWNDELFFGTTVAAAEFFGVSHAAIQRWASAPERKDWRWAE